MSSIHALGNSGNNGYAKLMINESEQKKLRNAKLTAVGAIVFSILFTGSLIAGGHMLIGTSPTALFPISAAGGAVFGWTLMGFAAVSVSEYLSGRRARDQFDKDFADMDPKYKAKLVKTIEFDSGVVSSRLKLNDKNSKNYQLLSKQKQEIVSILKNLNQQKYTVQALPGDAAKKVRILNIFDTTFKFLIPIAVVASLILWSYALFGSNATPLHTFGRLDALNVAVSAGTPLVLGTLYMGTLGIKEKKKEYKELKYDKLSD